MHIYIFDSPKKFSSQSIKAAEKITLPLKLYGLTEVLTDRRPYKAVCREALLLTNAIERL